MKTEHGRRGAELHGLHHRAISAELAGHSDALKHAETGIEALVADQRQVEAHLETLRQTHHGASEHLNSVQAEVYRVGGDIARVEQQIQHNRELGERLERARVETERAHAELGEHIGADREQIETLRAALADGEPRLATLREAAEQTAQAQHAAEAALSEWQAQWDEHAKASADSGQAAEVERTRLDYLDRQSIETGRHLEALRAEKHAADFTTLSAAAAQFAADHDEHRGKVETYTSLLDERKARHEELIEAEHQASGWLNEARTELQGLRGRLASLEALQHAALGQEKSAAHEWLERLGLNKSRRLGEVLNVDAGWETAVETVLSGLLEGVLVDAPHAHLRELAASTQADIALVATAQGASVPAATLAAHVRGPAAALRILACVYTAESADAAALRSHSLAAHESVITRDGEWLGAGYARVLRRGGAQAGVLAREKEIHALQEKIGSLQERAESFTAKFEDIKTQRADAERTRDDAQRELYVAHRRVAELAGQLQSQRGKLETAQARIERVDAETAEHEAKLAADEAQTREARARLEQAVTRMGDHEQRRQHLDGERRRLLEAREEARMNAREASLSRCISLRSASNPSAQRSARSRAGVVAHARPARPAPESAQGAEIAQQLEAGATPLGDLEAERQTYLNQRLLTDKRLVKARKALEDHDHEFRESRTGTASHRTAPAAAARGAFRTAPGRTWPEAARAAIARSDQRGRTRPCRRARDAAAGCRRGRMAARHRRARGQDQARLEPVNLAAISEYEEQSQRKAYLDAQSTDLNTALETLETAIRKIDTETRARFKETFDRVNTGLQELFPRLFGGGQAYLELTGESLLDSGVSIMARPPGKRVSNISLLSGGEKALAAVALVFSIFRLNPAPFCLLDEVDAPLDEANVGRFSQLVLEMSERVQFLFVTHNKATMEAAQQLCGVTMREPGVSRLVQVDLEEAAKLAGAA